MATVMALGNPSLNVFEGSLDRHNPLQQLMVEIFDGHHTGLSQ